MMGVASYQFHNVSPLWSILQKGRTAVGWTWWRPRNANNKICSHKSFWQTRSLRALGAIVRFTAMYQDVMRFSAVHDAVRKRLPDQSQCNTKQISETIYEIINVVVC